MTEFQYFHIFLTIVLGISITIIFDGVGSYLKIKKTYGYQIKRERPLMLWTAVIGLFTFQYFIAIAPLYEEEGLGVIIYILNLIIPTLLFLLCRIVVPDYNAPDVQEYITPLYIIQKQDHTLKNKQIEQAGETQAIETQASETQAGETQTGETQTGETQTGETQTLETQEGEYDLFNFFERHQSTLRRYGMVLVACLICNNFAIHGKGLYSSIDIIWFSIDLVYLKLFYQVIIFGILYYAGGEVCGKPKKLRTMSPYDQQIIYSTSMLVIMLIITVCHLL